MRDAPKMDAVRDRVREIFAETLATEGEIPADRPLIEELGYDSLDMIEASFALEEVFGFEFSSRNALEELDRRLGGDRVLLEGRLTSLGREIVFERMPELREIDLPESLPAAQLPTYFTLDTFSRIIHGFYVAAPDVDPATGEPTVCDDLRLLTRDSRQPVQAPSGDALLEEWLEQRASQLADH